MAGRITQTVLFETMNSRFDRLEAAIAKNDTRVNSLEITNAVLAQKQIESSNNLTEHIENCPAHQASKIVNKNSSRNNAIGIGAIIISFVAMLGSWLNWGR